MSPDRVERGRLRWPLVVLCLGVLMIMVDSTIVNVALPAIKKDLKFSDASVVWVMDSYWVVYAGFRMLSARLGDFLGHRRLFLQGMMLFTLASVMCASASSRDVLIAARALQGLGGALVGAAALSLIFKLFVEGPDRARAIGIYGFVASGGGMIGLILGGALTSALDWHWIFVINLPIGIAVYSLARNKIPEEHRVRLPRRVDGKGALILTAGTLLLVYAIVNADRVGWRSAQTAGLLLGASALFALLVPIESRVQEPILPPNIHRRPGLATCIFLGLLLAVSGSASLFVSLYLQLVRQYSPMDVTFAFLPASAVTGALSLGASAKCVIRFGVKGPLTTGLATLAAGLWLLAQTHVAGPVLVIVVTGLLLLSSGVGIAYPATMLMAMSDVALSETGLVSGIIESSAIFGTALGFSVLASLAAIRTKTLLASGAAMGVALNGGYHVAFVVGAICALSAACLSAVLLRPLKGKRPGGYWARLRG